MEEESKEKEEKGSTTPVKEIPLMSSVMSLSEDGSSSLTPNWNGEVARGGQQQQKHEAVPPVPAPSSHQTKNSSQLKNPYPFSATTSNGSVRSISPLRSDSPTLPPRIPNGAATTTTTTKKTQKALLRSMGASDAAVEIRTDRMPGHKRTVSWGDKPNLEQGSPGGLVSSISIQQQRRNTPPGAKNRKRSFKLSTVHSYNSDDGKDDSDRGGAVGYSSPNLKRADPSIDNSGPPSPALSNLTPPDYLEQPIFDHQDASSSMPPLRTDGAVELDDILNANPLESEAEALILKAIEKQDDRKMKHSRRVSSQRATNTETSPSLLNNIPVEAYDMFTTTTPAVAVGEPAEETPETVGLSPDEDAYSTPTKSRVSFSRNANERPPPPPPSAARSRRQPIHKPNETAKDNTLAGLTMALAGICEVDTIPVEPPKKQPKEQKINSGVTLAKNATLVYRKRNKGSGAKSSVDEANGDAVDNTEAPKRRTANENWGKLRRAVKKSPKKLQKENVAAATPTPNPEVHVPQSVSLHKKTDNDLTPAVLEDEDIEAGGASGAVDPKSDGGFNAESKKARRKRKRPGKSIFTTKATQRGVIGDFQSFVVERRRGLFIYVRIFLVFLLPCILAAFILYYVAENPPTGRVDLDKSSNGNLVNENGGIIDPNEASASWWLLFVLRQSITFSLARGCEIFIIDFLCLSTRVFLKVFGNFCTLLVVQSKGWPFTILMWGVFDFALLYGDDRFARHWLFYQDFAGIFNEKNPSGNITNNVWNTRALAIAVSFGAVVSLKRVWIGLFLGKKTYANYAEGLTKVIRKILLLCEVGKIGRELFLESNSHHRGTGQFMQSVSEFGMTKEEFNAFLQSNSGTDEVSSNGKESGGSYTGPAVSKSRYDGLILDPNEVDPTGSLKRSQKMKIDELLGAWEEPEFETGVDEQISISSILQFNQSLAFLDSPFMFSIAWGDVSNRDNMIRSSQEVYRRLCLTSDTNVLHFETLALAAFGGDASLDREKLKDLIRLLRPDRDGNLSLLDFVKSVDKVYKEARLLRASIKNSEKIDRAFERIINIAFYLLVWIVVLAVLGVDAFALFVSLSSIIIAFAFMIGPASSKMFEGWLFILARRPYDIGDRIHVSNIESDTDPAGSSSWIVNDVDLFTTTCTYATTGEKATLSNGSLANSRVINMARSPNASLYIYLKFPVSVPYARVKVFEQALRQFVKDRPREWQKFSGFRATQVMADLGYIEYVVVLQHRESWQSYIALLVSKAQVSSFCLELSKKLDMKYQSPPLPVDLALLADRAKEGGEDESVGAKFAGLATGEESTNTAFREIAAQFETAK